MFEQLMVVIPLVSGSVAQASRLFMEIIVLPHSP